MSWFLGFFKQLKEEGKMKSDDVKRELLKYIKLNKRKLRCTMIKIFKVKLTSLKTMLKEIQELR